jgi:hypothetical protein
MITLELSPVLFFSSNRKGIKNIYRQWLDGFSREEEVLGQKRTAIARDEILVKIKSTAAL